MNHALVVEGLTLRTKKQTLVENVCFELKRGECVALVGGSGSGKSLTALAIMQLLPQGVYPVSGDIRLESRSLFDLSERQMQHIRGERIGMIFQEPMSALNPVVCVGEQVAEVLRIHKAIPKAEIKARVISLFDEVALPEPHERYGWYPHQLSGGQKQRVMIAMALACEPDVLIADEPTTALDVTVQAQVLALLEKIKRTRKLSILFITHDMAVVSQIADHVVVMQKGHVVEQEAVDVLFRDPTHPYTRQLLYDASGRMIKRSVHEQKAPTVLSVEALRVYFEKRGMLWGMKREVTKAVDGIDLTLCRGETLALVGESGSGKSTVAKALLALVPFQGEIYLGSTRISGMGERAFKPFRKRIQMIFQDPFASLDPRMRIGDILKEGMESLGVGPRDKEAQYAYLQELLRQVELPESYLERYAHEFSGGERQRIGIARALALKPEVIICDEPTSALDVSVRSQILALLKRIQEETGVAYLFITHDLALVPSIADEVAVMCRGKIVEQGRVKRVMYYPSHSYTRTLLAAVPKLPDFIYGKEDI